MEGLPTWRPPQRMDALSFWLRTRLLSARLLLRECWRPSARRWTAGYALADAPVLAQQRSPLWTDGRAEEFVLVAGKVHNLRVARRAFHAVEVPAGQVLSFWQQLGRPTAQRGFVAGRELREGCVLPTLAGGICQLSNALATAATRAGFELVERHAHSASIHQAQPDADVDVAIDATVYWRHIDLKVCATHAWRLEVELSTTELVLTLRGRVSQQAHRALAPTRRIIPQPVASAGPVPRGCLSCDQTSCFRRRKPLPAAATQGRTAYLLDAWSPEFARYLAARAGDRFVPAPLRPAFWRPPPRGWRDGAAYCALGASWRRMLWQRLWARHEGGRRQTSLLDGQRWLALTYAKALTPLHTSLVVDQGLLPQLELLGVLEGRHVEVLASTLPIACIEARLDAAAQLWPQAHSLRDFRAPPAWLKAELHALARASRIITAHAEVAFEMGKLSSATIELLPWVMPSAASRRMHGRQLPLLPLLVFPASGLARKGAYELAAALQGLPCRLRVLGAPGADPNLWQGVTMDSTDRVDADWLGEARALVLPAHVEHAPRTLLLALAAGVPVIVTAACGLRPQAGLFTVPAGDVAALREAVLKLLAGAVSERPEQ
jgi:hypothetical protein